MSTLQMMFKAGESQVITSQIAHSLFSDEHISTSQDKKQNIKSWPTVHLWSGENIFKSTFLITRQGRGIENKQKLSF